MVCECKPKQRIFSCPYYVYSYEKLLLTAIIEGVREESAS
jgi:hypothetical protein